MIDNRHSGQRAFILGTGASLIGQRELLERLDGEVTFATSKLVLWKEMPFRPTYHVIAEWDHLQNARLLVWHGVKERFAVSERDLGLEGWTWVPKAPSGDYVTLKGMPGLDNRLAAIRNARSSVGTAVQLAVAMGCEPIYLLGCEVTDGGRAWAPDERRGMSPINLERIRETFGFMARAMAKAGRHLFDCTPGGTLAHHVEARNLEAVLAAMPSVTADSTTSMEVRGEQVLGGTDGAGDGKQRSDRKARRPATRTGRSEGGGVRPRAQSRPRHPRPGTGGTGRRERKA